MWKSPKSEVTMDDGSLVGIPSGFLCQTLHPKHPDANLKWHASPVSDFECTKHTDPHVYGLAYARPEHSTFCN